MSEFRRPLPNVEEVIENLPKIYTLNEAFPAKTKANRESGLSTYNTGEVTIFNGFNPEAFKKRMVVIAEYDGRSAQEIRERVSIPLTELADKHGLRLITPRTGDLPSHTTLQIGDFPAGINDDLVQSAIQTLAAPDSSLRAVTDDLKGEDVTLDSLVLAGSMFYVGVGDPTRDQETFGSTYRLANIKNGVRDIFECAPVPLEVPSGKRTYTNVIHSTVGRIVEANGANLEGFANEAYTTIGESIQRNPIRATVEDVFVGTAYQDIMRTTPQLFSSK